MIELHYFECQESEVLNFFTINELVGYLKTLKPKKYVWLATEDGEHGEIMVTESIDALISAIKAGVFNLLWNSPQRFYLQQYDSYEDAYSVALDMREPNPKCYAPLS